MAADRRLSASGLHHGGDLARARADFGCDITLDLSTGINPWPYPFTPPPDEAYARLPDSGDDDRLRTAASSAYGAPDPALVVPAPGSQALIQTLPRLRPPGAVAVVGPTYGEHAACWRQAGHEVREIADLPAGTPEFDVVVVTNPNNPDGRTFARERLELLAEALARRGGWLVVDEAFADLDPALSLAPCCDRPGIIVLRSFGKFFGLAGVRLGFALAPAHLATTIRNALGPWAVSGPAAAVGTEALADEEWMQGTRTRLAEATRNLDDVLTGHDLEVIGGSTLYRFVSCPDAHSLFDGLARQGVLVRHFPDQPHRLRVGLPEDDRAVRQLGAALATCRTNAAA